MDNFLTLTDITLIMDKIKQKSAYLKFVDMLNISSDVKEQIKLLSVEQDGYVIRFIENPSELLQLGAVNQYGANIKYIKNPSEQVQMIAVKRDPSNIKHIKNPSEQVQIEAVKQGGDEIEFITNPSEQVQLEAVKKDLSSILYISNPSITVCNYVWNNYPKYHVYLPIDYIKSKINKPTIDISNLTDDQIKVITKLITIMNIQNS